jgi:hypothetical protein
MICFFSRQEDGAPCADGTIKENRPASAMGGGIFRRINAASPSASAPLRPPPRLHLCGSQLEYESQSENSTFEPSQSTFEQAPTSKSLAHYLDAGPISEWCNRRLDGRGAARPCGAQRPDASAWV